MGELNSFYGAADIAFVGGSLKPTGGHNIIEPAMWVSQFFLVLICLILPNHRG